MRHKLQQIPAVRYLPVIGLSITLLLLLWLGPLHPVRAQEETPRAGLIIQFGADNVQTACVELGPDGEATGEEVLRAAGFDTVIDYTSGFGGGTVCKISDQGCDFPAEACFCECTMRPGDPCVYWTYFRLVEGQWRYSNLGVSNTTIRSGEVEAWVWALSGAGAAPPVMTFDEICGASSEPAITATATSSPVPPEPAAGLVPTAVTPTATVVSATPSADAPTTALDEASATTATPQKAAAESGQAMQATAVQAANQTVAAADEQDGAVSNLSAYAIFGVLVLLLAGGLFVMKVRGSI